MSDSWVNLHSHTEYSSLDGAAKLPALVGRATALGMPGVAITDHGTLSGAYPLWSATQGQDIKPIIGCEFYVAPAGRFHKEPVRWGSEGDRGDDISGSGAYTHLTVIADGSRGLRNLYRLHGISYSEGFYRKPRIDFEVLAEHSEGLIVTSGCPGSAISTRLRLGQVEEARKLSGLFKDVFGDRFYIELMYHGMDMEAALVLKQLELAEYLNVPTVATNDSHYVLEADAGTHDALLCLQTRSKLSDQNRFRFDGAGYHLKTREEMELLSYLPPESLNNTLEICDRVESYDEVFEHLLRMPVFQDPETDQQILKESVMDEVIFRYGLESEEYIQRAEFEIDLINSLGFPGYFLVLADIISDAKKIEGIRIGPGRGSAGGSLVALALGITELDPVENGLLFERFLNPERVSLPDIDIDVDDTRRNDLLNLVKKKYGHDNVAVIGTFQTIAAKRAVGDAAFVQGRSFAQGTEWKGKLPPAKFGRSPALSEYPKASSQEEREMLELAQGLEGLIRGIGQHAAGVVISPEPLSEILPLRTAVKEKDSALDWDGWVTAFDAGPVEALGLVKMDFLGLRNLGIIDETLHLLQGRKTSTGVPLLPTSPRECTDRATYELLSRGSSLGVFQLDSPGMRGLLQKLRPTKFADISAVLALYRPGPMGANAHIEFANRKNSGKPWSAEWAIHSELEEVLRPILEETYGLIVYQEQLIKVVQKVGGYSVGQADVLRKACGKKDRDLIAAQEAPFKEAALKNFSEEAVDTLWEVIVPFADYSFNKSHTVGYGLIAYWTAYLKANHPAEYFCALLSSVTKNPEKTAEYLAEAQRMGIRILPPDVNISGVGYTPDGEAIRYGISAIKGVGEKAFAALSSKRPYRDLGDFFRRVPATVLNVGTLDSLVRCGALDSLCSDREGLAEAAPRFAEQSLEERRESRKGQFGLVAPIYRPPGLRHDLSTRRAWESNILGVELSTGSLILSFPESSGVNEISYVYEVLRNNPGAATVTLDFGTARVSDCGTLALTDKAQRALRAAGITWEEQ